ncbi:MAG: hypothetical protein NTZ26_04640 [Candidatus Aminicenantes bacterium]|nr:hypothetical protein [Candidatus Aminicenantes bacterium]
MAIGALLLPALAAQEAATPISRAQFAAAYLRFETALQGVKLGTLDEIRVNKTFDALTLLFFTGSLAKAMENLNALTDSIDPKAPPALSVDLEARKAKAETMRAEAASIKARIDALAPVKPGLIQAQAASAARADLLARPFDAADTAQALMDPAALLAQIKQEAADLARGKNPFAGRKGDYWRVIKTGDRTIPVRLFCPAGVDASKPLPLIIAFHGSGGDENMFMDGYGAGLIKKLAAEHKAVLATPRTEPFAGARGAEAFDDLLRAVGADYSIDPKRVYVLGHSMGGMTTNALLVTRGEEIAAAACLCGFQGFAEGASGIPPTLIVAGELDPIVSPARIEPAFQKARAAGFPVEYRVIPNYGHTLTVGKVLPAVAAWLFSRGRV